jgi:lipopolysaccharide export system permease protein
MKPKILTRYLVRAHLPPFFFAVSALTLIMLLDQLGKRFGKLVGKGLDPLVIAEVFLYSIPFILAMTMPMAVLLAVLYTFNRMASDNEITALKANGVHLPSLVAPVLLMGTVLAGGMVWFNNTILPESNHRLQVLLSSISQKKPTFTLRERTINEVLEGELYIQVGRIDRKTNELTDVTIYDQRESRHARTIYAETGEMGYSPDRTDLYLTLFQGVTQQQKMKEPEAYQRIRFGKLVMRVPDVTNELERREVGGYRGDREMPIGAMQERVRAARGTADGAVEESRYLALYLTRRLLGRELERPRRPDPEEEEDAAAARSRGDSSAGSREGRTPVASAAGSGAPDSAGPDRPDGAVTRDGARGPEWSDTTDRTAGGASSRRDSAERARAAARDSMILEAKEDAYSTAVRGRSPGTVASKFSTLETRRESALGRAARYGVEIQKKVSIPAACIVFVLIGAPLAVRYREGGIAMVVGVSLAFFCAYYVSLVGGEELADELILSPFWAMWTPNVLFGAIGLGFLWRAVRVG